MQNLKENNRIYLSGGGNERQSFSLDKVFFEGIPRNGNFLYLPIALRGNKLYEIAPLWMNELKKLHERGDIKFEVIEDISNKKLEDLKLFDAIYIGGGNTWSLIKEIKESGFEDLLVQYVKSGRCIYGGSAGAIILGKRIDTHDDENIVKWPGNSGLNLLNGYSVACHFKNKNNDRYKILAQTNNAPIICLPEETGLIVTDAVAECIGTKPCTIYTSQGNMLSINSQEIFSLK